MIKKIIKNIKQIILSNSYTTKELIKIHGGKIDEEVFIGKDVLIDYDYCFLLTIEKGAVISAKTVIEFHDSCLPNVLGKGKVKIGKIKIGSRSYIGVNSVILPGVTIGKNSIIGACSLVNRDIPEKQVWGGTPVKYLCTVEELIKKRKFSENPKIKFFDWIGECEKRKIDYYEYKKKFIKKVKQKFF